VFGRGGAADGLEIYPVLRFDNSFVVGIKSESQSTLFLVMIFIKLLLNYSFKPLVFIILKKYTNVIEIKTKATE
jgi:hypothetical protein